MPRSRETLALLAALGLAAGGCGPGASSDGSGDSASELDASEASGSTLDDSEGSSSGTSDATGASDSSDTEDTSDTSDTGMPDLPGPDCEEADPSLADGNPPAVSSARFIAPNELLLTFTEAVACVDEVDPKQFRIAGVYTRLCAGGGCSGDPCPPPPSYEVHRAVASDGWNAPDTEVISLEHTENPDELLLRLSPAFTDSPCELFDPYAPIDCYAWDEHLVLDFADSFGAPLLDLGGEAMLPVDPKWVETTSDVLYEGGTHTILPVCEWAP